MSSGDAGARAHSRLERTVVALLSLGDPGLGQAYKGQLERAVSFAAAMAVLGAIALWSFISLPSVMATAVAFLIVVGFRLWTAYDAFRSGGYRDLSRKRRIGYVLLIGLLGYVLSKGLAEPQIRLIGDRYRLPSTSMTPTLELGDYLATEPLRSDPTRGQIVVFQRPDEQTQSYIKRIVAIPSDTVEMRNGQLLINNRSVAEPYAHIDDLGSDAVNPRFDWQKGFVVPERNSGYSPRQNTFGPLVTPHASYFLLGDNRDNSLDSRHFGFVHRELITSIPRRIYFSRDSTVGIRWGRIGRSIE